jgi:uncharacterized membrane protein
MKKVEIYKLALWLGIITLIVGFYTKISHYPMASFFLGFTSVWALIIIILGLKDVFSNKRINLTERIMWIVGFFFLTYIAGILYYSTFRKRNQ